MILSTGFWLDCEKCLLHIKMEVIGGEKLKIKRNWWYQQRRKIKIIDYILITKTITNIFINIKILGRCYT